MSAPDRSGSSLPLVPSRALDFSINIEGPDVSLDQGGNAVLENRERKMPYDGIVSELYIDIPNGVHSRAGFNVYDDARGQKMFPYNEESEYAAFNDVQDFWPVTFPMEEGDDIRVNYVNEDHNSDGHLLKVWAVVVGEDALPYSIEDLIGRDGVNF